jgi:hypothetical protein
MCLLNPERSIEGSAVKLLLWLVPACGIVMMSVLFPANDLHGNVPTQGDDASDVYIQRINTLLKKYGDHQN